MLSLSFVSNKDWEGMDIVIILNTVIFMSSSPSILSVYPLFLCVMYCTMYVCVHSLIAFFFFLNFMLRYFKSQSVLYSMVLFLIVLEGIELGHKSTDTIATNITSIQENTRETSENAIQLGGG